MKQTFPAKSESIEKIINFCVERLKKNHISDNMMREYRLVIEEVLVKLIGEASADVEIVVEADRRFNHTYLTLSVPGKPIVLYEGDEDKGGKIINLFRDYLRQSYSAGINYVTVSAPIENQLLNSFAALLLSVPVSFLLKCMLPDEILQQLNTEVVLPATLVFSMVLKMISGPVVFFTLAAFVINMIQTFEHDRKMVSQMVKYNVTSFLSVCIGFVFAKLYYEMEFLPVLRQYVVRSEEIMTDGLSGTLLKIFSPNIIEPFVTDNPLPLLLFALILGVASSKLMGTEGILIKNFIISLERLFLKMLEISYGTIHIFVFFALVFFQLEYGIEFLLRILGYMLAVMPLFVVLLILYAGQLWLNGISVRQFVKDYKTVIKENFRMASNTAVLPYNVRALTRKSKGLNVNVKQSLDLGYMMNMDGNCLLLSGISFALALACREYLGLNTLLGAMVIILLISSNQLGSFSVGVTITFVYLGISTKLFVFIILCEAAFGRLAMFMNSFGDIVTVAIDIYRARRAQEQT